MTDATSTELVPMHEVREALLSGRVPKIVDPDVMARMIGERILNATSPEENFSVQETVSAEDILDEPHVLRGAWFMPSEYAEDGGAIYAVLDLVNTDGEQVICTCGGAGVLRQVYNALEHGWLPWTVKFVEVGKQKAGRRRPLYLVTPEGPAGADAS